jgi:intermembrane space import and assembly protein 40
LPTVDSIVEEKRKQIKERLEKDHKAAAKTEAAPTKSAAPAETETETDAPAVAASPVGPAGLEEEAGQQGAFNPETGEINWDCPCLGGMANGPCGEEFKTAFSCFVYSEAEPKGMDCIDKFQGMQECFRQYPEIYGGELTDDDDDAEAPEAPAAPAASVEDDQKVLKDSGAAQSTRAAQESAPVEEDHQVLKHNIESQSPAAAEKRISDALPVPKPEPTPSEIPQKWDDATAANEEDKENKSE